MTFQYGLDLSRFPPRADKEILARGPRVVSTRALEHIYKVDVLVRAAELIHWRTPDARFVIAGEGSEGRVYRRMVRESKLDGIVSFLGFVPNEE